MIEMPKTFCLYCREIPRRAVTELHLKNMGMNATFYEGLHGKTSNIRAAEPTSHKDNGDPWFISQGHIALDIGHWSMWSHILHSGFEEALVLEDDAYLTTDFHQQYRQVRNDLPQDWELCYLGWLHRGHSREMEQVKGRVHTMEGCPFGTHAMLIRRRGIEKLLKHVRVFNQHIDILIARDALPHIKTYYVYPSIITQRSQNGIKNKPQAFRPTV